MSKSLGKTFVKIAAGVLASTAVAISKSNKKDRKHLDNIKTRKK